MLILLVAAAEILAVEAGTSIHPAHLPVSPPAMIMPTTSALVLLKWIFFELIRLEQSTSLRYLWLCIAASSNSWSRESLLKGKTQYNRPPHWGSLAWKMVIKFSIEKQLVETSYYMEVSGTEPSPLDRLSWLILMNKYLLRAQHWWHE
jgi:hypothetical protein